MVWQGIDPGVFFDKIGQFMQVSDFRMLVVKSVAFGLVVSSICCKKGFQASGGARGVGEATAKAVVASIIVIFAMFDHVITTLMTGHLREAFAGLGAGVGAGAGAKASG